MNQAKPVVAYVRVGTSEQEKNGYGIRIQRRDVRAFAQRSQLAIDKIYSDQAESGVVEDRKQLQELLHDCEQREIGAVIIPSIDRLSRDVRIAENLFWQFGQLGVRVLIVDMPNYDRNNRKDVLIQQIREAIAEENRKEIIERLWKGRRERVREGKPSGGVVPYGYRRRRKRFQPHPIESIVVRKIFKMSASGASCTKIARDLNWNGYARRNGKPWTRWQVLAIVQHRDLYERGILRYGAVTATDQRLIIINKER